MIKNAIKRRLPLAPMTAAATAAYVWPILAAAQEEEAVETLDSGNTAWMLTATALVLFMTIPGLSLFYGGLVRTKNVLSVLMQCFVITALATVLWVVIAWSLAFDTTGMEGGTTNLNSFIGGTTNAFLSGIDASSVWTGYGIPTTVFVTFQLTFFIITPALICGAYAERMKFSAMLLFTTAWALLVYAPICHMAWSGPGALFWDWGVLDFAGGTVVHINAGIAALVSCLLLGKRVGFPERMMPPHSMALTVTGAGMLWVGWFGFNAGSAAAANASAGMAMLVTQVATAAATLTWMGVEWIKHGKPSALGAATGAVAGLVAITPASGSAGPMGALAIGFASGLLCFLASTTIKKAFGYDDSLDAFGVHGIGGIVGAILTGVFASTTMGGQMEIESIASQVVTQAKSVGVTIIWSGVLSFVILKLIDLTIGLRVTAEEESQGLDLSLHGESGYNL
jgi:Amt family ammonium transporter